MNRKYKKIITILCSIALVISSLTVYNQKNIEAADDYSGVDFTKVTSQMIGTYEYYIKENTLTGYSRLNFYRDATNDYIQIIGSGDSKMATATITINGEPAGGVAFDRAEAVTGLNVTSLADNAYYEFQLTGDGGNITFVLKKGNPTGGGESESSSEPVATETTEEVTTEEPTTEEVTTEEPTTEEVTTEKPTESETPVLKTSDSIAVEGFQIKTNGASDAQVAFRTVCKAPNVGSTITVGGVDYTVASMGTIYAVDPNTTGYHKNNEIDATYTELTLKDGTYIGAKKYQLKGTSTQAFAYIATSAGILNNWNINDTSNTYYVRTMTNMYTMVKNTMHVRAFVVATDGTIIYGTKTAKLYVPQVADYLYTNSMTANYQGHEYLYNNILNNGTLIGTDNPYYRTSPLNYGWGDNLYVPGQVTGTVTDGTLEDLNSKN